MFSGILEKFLESGSRRLLQRGRGRINVEMLQVLDSIALTASGKSMRRTALFRLGKRVIGFFNLFTLINSLFLKYASV